MRYLARLLRCHFKKFFVVDELLLDHVGLPHFLVLIVHLIHFICWVGRRDYSKTFLQLALFSWSSPSLLKVVGWGGAGDLLIIVIIVIIVTASVRKFGFGTLDSYLESDVGLRT